MELSFTPRNREFASSDSDELEPLGWAALSARLAATHQLRRELNRDAGAHPRCGTASFAPDPARELLASAQMFEGVNLEPLANGKAGGVMGGVTGEGNPEREGRARGRTRGLQ